MTQDTQGLIDVGRLILTFAKVNRVTLHEDGKRPESDTDHTVMLSVCACALAEKMYPTLDRGKVAEFAIVHDLVEAYALDTDSFGLSKEEKAEKDIREHEAYIRIESEFKDVFPWIYTTISAYEALDTAEARFVKTVDKCMTKITHLLNHGAYFKQRGLSRDVMWDNYQRLVRDAEFRYGAEFPEIIAISDELILETRKVTYGD